MRNNISKTRAYNRMIYARRKKAGKCTKCGRPAIQDRTRCEACSHQHSLNAQARKMRMEPIQRALRICRYCETREAMPGTRCCGVCSEHRSEITQAWREARVAAHECIDCGKPAEPNRRRCSQCLERNRRQQREYRDRLRARKKAA